MRCVENSRDAFKRSWENCYKWLFMKMAPKAKKEATAPPKSKQRLCGQRKKCWKKSTATHKKRSTCHPPSRHWSSEGSSHILGRAPPGENKLYHYAIIKVPNYWISHGKAEGNNALVFIVNVKTNRHHIQLAVKFIDMEKVNILIRPHREKKT